MRAEELLHGNVLTIGRTMRYALAADHLVVIVQQARNRSRRSDG